MCRDGTGEKFGADEIGGSPNVSNTGKSQNQDALAEKPTNHKNGAVQVQNLFDGAGNDVDLGR